MFDSARRIGTPNWGAGALWTIVAIGISWGAIAVLRMVRMPLHSYSGALPPLSDEQKQSRDRMAADVRHLTVTIGERSVRRADAMKTSAVFFLTRFQQLKFAAKEHPYSVQGISASNVEAILPGADTSTAEVIVGAHYDSVFGTVGANDNASGVAAVLELARELHESKFRRSIRFVLFANEEPPFFQSEQMGSRVYARQLKRQGVRVHAMMSLETIGYYSDKEGSQTYPSGLGTLYPSKGNFIAWVGNPASADLLRTAIRTFRESTPFPSEGAAAPTDLPGVGWSDQWSFWQEGYPAIMVTDTALYRYPYYHTTEDTYDKLDYDRMVRVVDGIRRVLEKLANER